MQNTPLKIRIAHLYPDLLNIYGDMGNILTLKKRLEWREIEVEICPITAGTSINSSDFDLFFAGGGQDKQQIMAAAELKSNARELRRAADLGKPMLVICGSYQLFGKYYKPFKEPQLEGISILDSYTEAGEKRHIGNVTATCEFLEPRTIVGFENHSGLTYLGEGALPFVKVQVGAGNNGKDKTEGAVYKNVFGTYLHGPILPKNPHFADHLLKLALDTKYNCEIPLLPLNDEIEIYAHNSRIKAKY